jgi:hypothetical protein
MPRARFLWFAPILALASGILSSVAGPKPGVLPEPPLTNTQTRDAGETFCPPKALVYGTVIIPRGRCYLIAVLRESAGTFLALAPANTPMAPALPVRLDTAGGFRLKKSLFVVPLSMEAAAVPLNTLRFVPARIDDWGMRLNVVVLGTRAENAPAVTFLEQER